MAQTFTGRKRIRKYFGKVREGAVMPNLIEVQKASYDQFLQIHETGARRTNDGLQAVYASFASVAGDSGISTWNVAPRPRSLSTHTLPA